MNVLHLSAVKTFGGGENHILNLSKELQRTSEINNKVLCVRNSAFLKILDEQKINNTTAPLSFKFDPRFVMKIIQSCRKEQIDLIHIHDPTALTLAVTATKLANLPPFIFSKKTSFPIKNRKTTLYKYNHPNIKKILCVSEETKRIAADRISDHQKLVTVFHGTNLNKVEEAPFELRKKYNIPKSRKIIGTIANHIRAKKLDTWIDVVDHIVNKRKLTDFHFVEIGSPTKRTPGYIDRIREKNIEDHITFTGFLPEASSFIPQFDISLLTSQSEGLPQFIYESFHYKVPVVSTNVGGIPEIIIDGKNGMLTNPYEAAQLGDKLIALSRDRNLQEKFTEISEKLLHNNFSTKIMAEKTIAEYKNVLYGKN